MPSKWDRDATPAGKAVALFTMLLFNNRAFSLTELSSPDRLNVSKPTVLRLIKQLEQACVGNIRRELRGREAWYRLERPARVPDVSLNAEGLSQLALCREFLASLLPGAMQREIQASLDHMAAFLPRGEREFHGGVGAAVSKGRIDYTPFQGTIAILMQAIREARVCLVQYRAALGGKTKEYDFAPKRLLACRESLYAEGWIVTPKGTAEALYDDPCKLAVHRFQDCVLTVRSSKDVPDIPPPSTEAFGVMEDEPFAVAVRFDASAAVYVAERQWSDRQRVEEHGDGSITLHAQMFNGDECIAWVLGFGDAAEVLEPAWLRREIKQTIGRMKARYAAKKPKEAPCPETGPERGAETGEEPGAEKGEVSGMPAGQGGAAEAGADGLQASPGKSVKDGTLSASVAAGAAEGKAAVPDGQVHAVLEESMADHDALYRELAK